LENGADYAIRAIRRRRQRRATSGGELERRQMADEWSRREGDGEGGEGGQGVEGDGGGGRQATKPVGVILAQTPDNDTVLFLQLELQPSHKRARTPPSLCLALLILLLKYKCCVCTATPTILPPLLKHCCRQLFNYYWLNSAKYWVTCFGQVMHFK
jgi:hypothetical protein